MDDHPHMVIPAHNPNIFDKGFSKVYYLNTTATTPNTIKLFFIVSCGSPLLSRLPVVPRIIPTRNKCLTATVPFRWVHLAREAPSVRIGFFGVRNIESMGEFCSIRRTITSSMSCCMHSVEGECYEIDMQRICLVNAS